MMSPQKVLYQVIPVIPNIYIYIYYMRLFREFGKTLFCSTQNIKILCFFDTNARSPGRAMASGLVWVVKPRFWEPNIWGAKVAVGTGCQVDESPSIMGKQLGATKKGGQVAKNPMGLVVPKL